MEKHTEIKQLLSVYYDGEAAPSEIRTVEQHLRECAECKKYLNDLKNLSSSFKKWNPEDLSLDLEQKINKRFWDCKSKEEWKMKNRISTLKMGAGVAIIFMALFYISSMQQTHLQARLRDSVVGLVTGKREDQIALKTANGHRGPKENTTIQYEPYYLKTNYPAAQAADLQRKNGQVAEFIPGNTAKLEDRSRIVSQRYEFDVAFDRENIPYHGSYAKPNTEEYDSILENEFLDAKANPLSTFSIDVDTASYSNVRRFLTQGQLPPSDAVRIEEFINYFTYDYPQPSWGQPFSITMEAAPCPWNPQNSLVLIGVQGKNLQGDRLPASNLVFLIDVSGSMNAPNKLPLVQDSFRMLVNSLRPEDRVSIVVYAGSAGLVLDATPGNQKTIILSAIDHLQAGGSTAGGQGIQLAYQIAKQNFIHGANNRVILATDGDFNVGISNDADLVRLIEEKRNHGIFLTVLGFGMGNYKDSKMEKLADKGNGNYAYIDTLQEAQKVMVQEIGTMLFPIAKDVKIQVEFNPAQVKSYRLIGYENRILAKEDFNDDTKDAGELGAGHSVTAFYEIVPAASTWSMNSDQRKVDPLKYQEVKIRPSAELMTVKLCYKDPNGTASRLIRRELTQNHVGWHFISDNFKFASAVAEFGLLLKNSPHRGNATYQNLLQRIQGVMGHDPWGYRREFAQIVERAAALSGMNYIQPQPVPFSDIHQNQILFKGINQ